MNTFTWMDLATSFTSYENIQEGVTWTLKEVVDTGSTAYSSLQIMPDGSDVGLLYERENYSFLTFVLV